jgi:hypothetical protein
MHNSGANPDVADAICNQSMSWQADQPLDDLEFANSELQKTIDLQDTMGWEAAFAGCWAQEWAKEQDNWCHFEQSGFTCKHWLTAVIEKLWNVA